MWGPCWSCSLGSLPSHEPSVPLPLAWSTVVLRRRISSLLCPPCLVLNVPLNDLCLVLDHLNLWEPISGHLIQDSWMKSQLKLESLPLSISSMSLDMQG